MRIEQSIGDFPCIFRELMLQHSNRFQNCRNATRNLCLVITEGRWLQAIFMGYAELRKIQQFSVLFATIDLGAYSPRILVDGIYGRSNNQHGLKESPPPPPPHRLRNCDEQQGLKELPPWIRFWFWRTDKVLFESWN